MLVKSIIHILSLDDFFSHDDLCQCFIQDSVTFFLLSFTVYTLL